MWLIVVLFTSSVVARNATFNAGHDSVYCPAVVVGAGVSGLSAAKIVSEKSCSNVCVSEAENRTGGRVFPVTDTLGGDGYVELNLGANYIHEVLETEIIEGEPPQSNLLLQNLPRNATSIVNVPPPVDGFGSFEIQSGFVLEDLFQLYRDETRRDGENSEFEFTTEDAYNTYVYIFDLMVENSTASIRGHYDAFNTRPMSFLEKFDSILTDYGRPFFIFLLFIKLKTY